MFFARAQSNRDALDARNRCWNGGLSPWAYRGSKKYLWTEKELVDAISQLNQAIAIDSARPVARLWLGFALLETGDLADAERELTKALVMGGAECVAAHYHLARIYLVRGDRTEALRAVRAYLEDAPKGEYAKEAKQLENQIKN